MKHAVLGAGAIGGLIATGLGAIGEEVLLLMRPEKLRDYPERLSLEQPNGSVTAPAHAQSHLTTPVDVLWIATKTYQLESALESVSATPGIVVPLLNGVDHIAVLRARFGDGRVVPAAIAVEAERLAEGRFAQRSFVRLTVAATGQPLLAKVLPRLQEQLGFVCRFVDNEQTLLWTKLCFLAPFALVTTASGKNKGEIFASPEWRDELYSAVAEAAAVANAEHAEVEAVKIQSGFDALPDTMRSSMAKDLVAGRHLELDAIGGPILRGGARHGIAVPTVQALTSAIQAQVDARQP